MGKELKTQSLKRLHRFLLKSSRKKDGSLPAVSLFSGAGLSDFGYECAGFQFHVQAEIDRERASIGKVNFPNSRWLVDDVTAHSPQVVRTFSAIGKRLALLVATPPCQGMSSSNSSRGKRDSIEAQKHSDKNTLVFSILPIVEALNPRMFVVENVRQLLTLEVKRRGRLKTVPQVLSDTLPEYQIFQASLNVADYGVPQSRRRAVIVGIHKDEACLTSLHALSLMPLPKPTHFESPKSTQADSWITIRQWLRFMRYPCLDSRTEEVATGRDVLHNVPVYSGERYTLLEAIPAYSGKSAYENDVCQACGTEEIFTGIATCPNCGEPLWVRPIVVSKRGVARLIRGFKSSYRRMAPDRPAPTITTNTSHVGSDFKIHPWENRVLSARECADIQTIPRAFDWSPALLAKKSYLVRQLIGESFPPYFTKLHGFVLRGLLNNDPRIYAKLMRSELPEATAGSNDRFCTVTVPAKNPRVSPSKKSRKSVCR